jgi:type VI secretion system ImpM family protein
MVLGFLKRASGGVGCYGKLPLHGDYVSHANDGPEARFLSAWLDQGYRLTPGRDNPDAAELGYLVRSRRKALVGVLWPSGDASGTRRFPFAMFATVATRALAGLGELVTVGIAPTIVELAKAFPGIREAAAVDQIHSILSKIQVPPLPEADEVRKEFGRESANPLSAKSARPVLFEVLRFADALGGGRKGEAPSFAVRLPLRTEYPASLETAAWLSVLGHRLGDPGLPTNCHLFVRRSKGVVDGEMFVIHRDLKPEDLGFVLSPTEDYPYGNVLALGEDDPDAAEFVAGLETRFPEGFTLADLVSVGRE